MSKLYVKFQMLRLMFNFFVFTIFFSERERTHLYIDRVKDKIFFKSGKKHIEFLSCLIKMKNYLNISYMKII